VIETVIGASPWQTRYKIRTADGEYYVRCGADLLLNGMRHEVQAEGRCPVCESTVQFQVRDRHVGNLRPETSILHVVEVPMSNGRISIQCEGSPLFDKESCLLAWLQKYRGRPGMIIRPQEFLDRMFRLGMYRGEN
jgi:hypothetical protein